MPGTSYRSGSWIVRVVLGTGTTGVVLFVTVTAQDAVLPPSSVFTSMVALPSATPVTLPLLSTVAALVLLLVHVTPCLVALPGSTVAVSVALLPASIVSAVLSNFTPVTATGLATAVTVTLHVAVLLPSVVVTVIVVLPAPIAVTLPLLSTLATFSSLLFQLTLLSVASVGSTVAVSVSLFPSSNVMLLLFSFTPVTLTTVTGSLPPL